MKQPCDMILLERSRGGDYIASFNASMPLPSKQQKVHFAKYPRFLHHTQPPCNILSLSLHKKIVNTRKNKL